MNGLIGFAVFLGLVALEAGAYRYALVKVAQRPLRSAADHAGRTMAHFALIGAGLIGLYLAAVVGGATAKVLDALL